MGQEKQSGQRGRGWPRAGLSPERPKGRCEQKWGGREMPAGHQGTFSFQRCGDPGETRPQHGVMSLCLLDTGQSWGGTGLVGKGSRRLSLTSHRVCRHQRV